ncbi:MAG: (2Fe-2S) ferredoxin domain-containing protein [Candidatus Cloacimonetes bacterium]|nr:(2Fe-2S) ferredoxin domain-containing protein [Candidatus Cloacimonadota bacterium]
MKTLEELRKIRKKAQQEMKLRSGDYRIKIVIGMGTSGIAMGAREVMKAVLDEISKRQLTDVMVTQTGEKGLSSMEPVVDVIEANHPVITYGNVSPVNARRIVLEHIVNGRIVNELVVATKIT